MEVWWEPLKVAANDASSARSAAGENWALEFDGKDDYVEIPTLKYDGKTPFTIEINLSRGEKSERGCIVSNKFGSGMAVSFERAGQFTWDSPLQDDQIVKGKRSVLSFTSRKMLDADQHYQLSFVINNKTIKAYVDGKVVEEARTKQPLKVSTRHFLFGADYKPKAGLVVAGRFFHGIIDEVRISNTARYTKNFTPEKRFETDKNTLALYHFDSGSGTVLKDSSGNGHHGKIVGAKWVKVDDELNVLEYVWPKDQPAPAIAPFNAKQAKEHQAAWAKHLGVPVEITNSIGMKLRVIPPGEFLMGSSKEEIANLVAEAKEIEKKTGKKRTYTSKAFQSESPQHQVILTRPFGMSIHEVTRGQFRKFVEASSFKTDAQKSEKGGLGFKDGKSVRAPEFAWNTNLGFDTEQTEDHPVVNVSWNDAVAFCKWLSEKEGVTYRLPTEAEWEFSCRAGSLARFSFGNDESLLGTYAWYGGKGGLGTKPGGIKAANSLGLFNMHGNVSEWCSDTLRSYMAAPAVDPVGINENGRRVDRGGHFLEYPDASRSASRTTKSTQDLRSGLGFRIVRTFEKPKPVNPYARDRAAAEWVLSVGGKVRVSVSADGGSLRNQDSNIDSKDKLPKQSFRLSKVELTGRKHIDPNKLTMLSNLPDLESIDFTATNVLSDGLRNISPCPNLSHLTLRESTTRISAIRGSQLFPNVRYLSLSNSQIDDGWKFLESLPSLAYLTVERLPEKPAEIGKLASCKSLRQILLIQETQVDPSRVRKLQQANPNLRVVTRSGKRYAVIDRDPVAEAVKTLVKNGWTLSGTFLNADPWESDSPDAFKGRPFTVLKVKLPKGKEVTAESLRILSTAGISFSLMDARAAKNANQIAKSLRDKKHIANLWLTDSSLDDDGLLSLTQVPYILRLDVVRCKVTKQGIEEFKRRKPRSIVVSGFGTFPYEHKLPPGWKVPATYIWPKNQPAPAIAPFNAKQAKEHQTAWAKHLGVKVETTNSIGMKFRVIPPGEFLMGSSKEEIAKLLEEAKEQKSGDVFNKRIPVEGLQHRVTLTKPFGLAIHEVTRGQFRQFVDATGFKTEAERDGKGGYGYKNRKSTQAPDFVWNSNLGFETEQTDDHPVVNVSWNDAVAFCEWLSRKDRVTYRLPTEAEWEFTCRAGNLGRFSFGNDNSKLGDHAWYGRQGGNNTKPVGLKRQNSFGVFDLLGNVNEWCHDGMGPYTASPAVNPIGPTRGDKWDRVMRSGSFVDPALGVRCANRTSNKPGFRHFFTGFRIVRTFEKPKPANPYARDRAAAEWVISQGGSVGISFSSGGVLKSRHRIRSVDDLPDADFRLLIVEVAMKMNADAERLSKLPALQTVHLYGSNITWGNLSSLLSDSKLELLGIGAMPKIRSSDLHHNKQLVGVVDLRLRYSQIDDKGGFLDHLPSLRKFIVSRAGSLLSDSNLIRNIANCLQLRQCILEGANLDTKAADRLQKANPALRIVLVDQETKKVKVIGRDPVAAAVKTLTENGWQLSGQYLNGGQWESGMANGDARPVDIFDVTLPRNQSTTAEALKALLSAAFSLNTLVALELQKTDQAVETFISCKRILNVNLQRSDLTDQGLSKLSKLKMARLDITGTKVTVAGVEEFKRRVPGCIVISDFGIYEYEHKLPPGWKVPATHTWPKNQPAPAIAPFNAKQAKEHQAAWAKHLGVPVEKTNSIGMKFRLIPPGEFLMGSTPKEIKAALKVASEVEVWRKKIQSEGPQHKVVLTKPVYVGVSEVTQSQYEQIMETNPSHFAATGEGKDAVTNLETGNHPVEKVSWNDAAEFCAKLSQQEKLKPFYFRSGETITPLEGTGYRLPTEAEWESACRAGTTTRFWSGDEDNNLVSAGWYASNSGGRTHAAGELKANPFGLSDVHGNVWEWVQDSWDPTFYGTFKKDAAIDPFIPFSAASQRVLRGGNWFNTTPSYCRSSNRHASHPANRHSRIGFRVVLVVESVHVSRP